MRLAECKFPSGNSHDMRKADQYTLADHFRALADGLSVRAVTERAPAQRAELQRLADCYAELAKQQSPADHFARGAGPR
jgi:hypothetical protein